MRKLFFPLSFFISFLFLSSPARGVCLPCQKAAQTEGIFSDSAFSQSTHNFSSGQMVYVRVTTAGSGEERNELRLLDSAKREIKSISLSRSGASPYIYTASFPAPTEPGIYYVDIKIEGEGSSFASQENINVSGSGTSVSTQAESVVDQEDFVWLTPTPTPFPRISPLVKRQATPTRTPYQSSPSSTTGGRSWWLVISDFFQNILFYLRSCLPTP